MEEHIENLKPCPFCGCVKQSYSESGGCFEDWFAWIACNKCGASVHVTSFSKCTLADKWNRRVNQ